MRSSHFLLFLCLAIPAARADEQLRATQEELRRRSVYFGDIDGRESPEVAEALKRYQRKKGFTATGRADGPTLRSLGLAARGAGEEAPKELPWPEEPVLKTDVSFEPVEEARELSRETGIAIRDLLPVAELTTPAKKRAGSAVSSRTGKRGQVGQATKRSGQPVILPGGKPQRLDEAQLAPLVQGYLKAAERGDVQAEIGFLADQLIYAHYGVLDRRVVERTLRRYYSLWPSRSYRLAGPLQYQRDAKRGRVTVTFPVEFKLKRKGATVHGYTQTRLVFDAATSDPRIVNYQERRLRGL